MIFGTTRNLTPTWTLGTFQLAQDPPELMLVRSLKNSLQKYKKGGGWGIQKIAFNLGGAPTYDVRGLPLPHIPHIPHILSRLLASSLIGYLLGTLLRNR